MEVELLLLNEIGDTTCFERSLGGDILNPLLVFGVVADFCLLLLIGVEVGISKSPLKNLGGRPFVVGLLLFVLLKAGGELFLVIAAEALAIDSSLTG